MRTLLTIIAILSCFLATQGQTCTKTIITKSDTIYFDPEKAPYTEDGLELYMGWISNHMKPELRSHDDKQKKKVFVSFVVDEQGHLSDFKIEKGAGAPYDSEAIKLIRNHPHKWIPGQCGIKNVKTRMLSFVWF